MSCDVVVIEVFVVFIGSFGVGVVFSVVSNLDRGRRFCFFIWISYCVRDVIGIVRIVE